MFEFFGGLGVESTPLHDMASARQYHNEQLHMSLLKLSPYMFEFVVGLVWKVLPYMVRPQLVDITMKSYIFHY